MSHLTDEQITEAYYDGLDESAGAHIRDCEECRAAFERLSNLLDGARDYPVPERGSGYGGEVWTRLLPRLEAQAPKRRIHRWWVLAPALAALLVAAFMAGRFSRPPTSAVAGIPEKARARVLTLSIGDHLERSGIVLSEVANADEHSADLDDERVRARDLLEQNRLLRQAALHNGDTLRAALLDELERVLLDIANGPSRLSPQDFEALRRRIEADGLLFRVHVLRTNISEEGQKL